MDRCFVAQPFDKDKYDQRFKDTYKPAIEKVGLEAYRVDNDPTVIIPIHTIEQEIRKARIVLADITEDNPNVWFEVGFALSANKKVVLICAKDRERNFPFDVQHRKIIHYATGSKSNFEELEEDLVKTFEAYLRQELEPVDLSELSSEETLEGLHPHEMAVLIILASYSTYPGNYVFPNLIKKDVKVAGFTDVAFTLALRSLLNHGMTRIIGQSSYNDPDGKAYILTESGWKWLENNKSKIALRKEIEEDDLPF